MKPKHLNGDCITPGPGGWHRLRPALPALAFGAACILLAGCGKPREQHAAAQPDLPAVQARVQAVAAKKTPAIEEVVGTVRAKLRATLEAKTSGRITELPVVLGQQIKAGELIARLHAPEIKARLDQAEASLQHAEREWKRVSALRSQQAATQADSDAAEARYLSAQGAVAEARALMGYVEILAPFDGVVTRKWADRGDLAAPGKPLVDIEDPARLQLETDVPEGIAARIQQDARMTILLDDSATEIAGTVVEIAPISDPASRTFRVKLDLPAPDPQSAISNSQFLRSGRFARLLVPLGETASLRVPSSAVVHRGQMEIVFAVEDQRARLHLVKTGRRFAEETEILSGLDPGDTVVVENASQLADGQPLQAR